MKLAGPVVVDASVVVEYLVELRLTRHASDLFARLVGEQELDLWAPDLLYPESASALRKLARRRLIDASAGETSMARLMKLPINCTGAGALMPRVWALRHVLTPYDACYVALAERLRAPLITADRRLARTRIPDGPERVFLGELDA